MGVGAQKLAIATAQSPRRAHSALPQKAWCPLVGKGMPWLTGRQVCTR